MLWGRGHETAVLDQLLESVRGGESRVLVLHGEAGVGKSALLGYVAKRASRIRVARAAGVEGFAERTRRELLATGETARTRAAAARSQLTAQETQVVELARQGLSNSEIGARLFISPRTVEYHLHKVFTKLGVTPACRCIECHR